MNKQKGKELAGYELLEETQFEKDFQSTAIEAKPVDQGDSDRQDDSALVRRLIRLSLCIVDDDEHCHRGLTQHIFKSGTGLATPQGHLSRGGIASSCSTRSRSKETEAR